MNLKPLLVIGAIAGLTYLVFSSKFFAQSAPVTPPNLKLTNLYKQLINMDPQQLRKFFAPMSENEMNSYLNALDPNEAARIRLKLMSADEET